MCGKQVHGDAQLVPGRVVAVRTGRGRPAMRLESEDLVLDLGESPPEAVLRAGAFEMTMALTGRRTDDQIRALDWDGDPSQYLDIFSAYMTPS